MVVWAVTVGSGDEAALRSAWREKAAHFGRAF
jgi:hypothetical protein